MNHMILDIQTVSLLGDTLFYGYDILALMLAISCWYKGCGKEHNRAQIEE